VTQREHAVATISRNLHCGNCGYNLRTLAVTARCPECGEPVAWSLEETAFRFRNAETWQRVRKGLLLFVIGLLLYSVFNIALTVISYCCWIYQIPKDVLEIVSPGIHYTINLSHVLIVIGLVTATWPFGRRGDRYLWLLGLVIAVLGSLCAIPSLVSFFHSQFVPRGATTTHAWGTYGFIAPVTRRSIHLLIYVLAWIHLLARLRFKRFRALWIAMAATVLFQFMRFACSVTLVIAWIDWTRHMTISGGMLTFTLGASRFRSISIASVLDVSRHRIVAAISLMFLLTAWLYLRKLGERTSNRCGGGLTE